MKHATPRRTGEAVGSVGLTAVAALGAVLRHGSLLELGIAQAALAVLLALAGAFLEARGLGEGFLLGAAGAVLLVSGLLLVLWTDRDTDAKPQT